MAQHHPSDELLLAYAAGSAAEAVSLVIATHLTFCPGCRAAVEHFEALGGALVEALTPAPLPAALLQQVMSRIDDAAEEHESSAAAKVSESLVPGGDGLLPRPLRDYLEGPLDQLPWQRVGPVSALELVGGEAWPQAHLLRVKPGTTIPRHSHAGLELVLILAGGMRDDHNRYRRGDVSQADSSVTHEQATEAGADCVCLVATDGPLKLSELAGIPAGPRINS